jgi:hypothetical protein
MKHEISLLYSEDPITGPNLDVDESGTHFHTIACILGSGFDNSIYLDFLLAERQLFVTPHKLGPLSSLSGILAPGFCTVLPGRRILTSLAGESSLTRTSSPDLYCPSWQTNLNCL